MQFVRKLKREKKQKKKSERKKQMKKKTQQNKFPIILFVLIYLSYNFSDLIHSGFSNLAGLPALEHCDLSDNGLALSLSEVYHYIIAPLRDCTALRSLDLSSNPLCADIQEFDYFLIAHLTALEFVNGRAVTKEQRKHAEKLAKARWSRVGVRTFTASMWPLPPRVEPSLTAIAEQVCCCLCTYHWLLILFYFYFLFLLIEFQK